LKLHFNWWATHGFICNNDTATISHFELRCQSMSHVMIMPTMD